MGKVACPHFSKSTVYLLHPTKHTPHNSIYYYYYYYREIQKYFFYLITLKKIYLNKLLNKIYLHNNMIQIN